MLRIHSRGLPPSLVVQNASKREIRRPPPPCFVRPERTSSTIVSHHGHDRRCAAYGAVRILFPFSMRSLSTLSVRPFSSQATSLERRRKPRRQEEPQPEPELNPRRRRRNNMNPDKPTQSPRNSNNNNNNNSKERNLSKISIAAKRRQLDHFFSLWLRRDPTWRECVMELLDLPSDAGDAAGRRNSTLASSALRGRNFYQDSIPSFVKKIKLNKAPEPLKKAMDGLIQAGLHDAETLKKYNQMSRWHDQRQELVKKMDKRREELDYLQKAKATAEQEIQDFQKQLDALPEVDSLLGRTMHSVQSMLSISPDRPRDDAHQIRQKRDTLQLKIQNRKEIVARTQTTIDSVNVKLAQLQDELDPSRLPLQPADYEAIRTAADAARADLCGAFAAHVRDRNSQMLEQYRALDAKTDLTRPHDWFLHARLDQRKIIFHGGPTNSGKTYTALQRLKQAPRGAYLAPLRLLAAEVYEQLTAEGIYCNLFTGQERREIPFATHSASTVEMAATNQDYDVIVLDEIQMIADSERGFAWTRALLGSRCREIHVCGGLEAVPIVRRLAEACGDDFEVLQYERFSVLQIAEKSLAVEPDQRGSYSRQVQPGDCVVAFSRDDIFAIKREIEKTTKHKCCIIYGSLPPSTRSEQARRFNDPDSGYDVLVASDAIGMGLNLNIRRIIFNSIYKNDGSGIVKLDHSAIKQIAGRAGRRNSPFPIGEVTTRDPRDLPYVRECMSSEIKPIAKAGLLPTATHIETFSDALEEYGLGHGPKNLHKILLQFTDMASVKSDYFVCRQAPMVHIAHHLADLDLPIADKYLFCLCPVQPKNRRSMQVMKQFASKQAAGKVAGLSGNMLPRKPKTLEDLSNLCHLFNSLELFLWLQAKFPPGNMMEHHTALARRDQAIEMIGQGLAASDTLRISHCYVLRDKWIRRQMGQSETRVFKDDDFYGDDEEADEDWDERFDAKYVSL